MLNIGQIKKLIGRFFHEACHILEIDDTQIPICYERIPIQTRMFLLLKDADILMIDVNLLERLVLSTSYTPIRMECYKTARNIYNRRRMQSREITLTSEEEEIDSYAFSYVLGMLNGLRLPIPPLPQKEPILNRIEEIVNAEFHENCILRSSPSCSIKGEREYYLKKNESTYKSSLLFFRSYTPKMYIPTVCPIKGSKEHPFDNVEEAAQFILEEEKKAFDADEFMQSYILKRKYNYCIPENIYNIQWSDAFASWIHPEASPDSFIVNQLVSGRFSLKPNLYGRKFLYRGQTEYYEKCTPSIFRDKTKDYFLDDMILNQELMLLCKSHPLVQLFERGIDLWHDTFRFEVNYGGLSQHYYNKTSYIDLTSDIEAAKFFAVTDYDREKDQYIAHTNTSKLGVMYYYELSMPGAFSYQRERDRMLSTIGKQVFMRSGQQRGFLLNMEKGTDFNSFPEVHKVFFRHDPFIAKKIFNSSNDGSLYFPSDILQEMWKRKKQDMNRNPVVSLEAVRYNVKKNPKETIKGITHKLYKMYGIKVEDYIPQFDKDLIAKFYDDIAQGWWQDVFCKDIYFASADGSVYKDLLNNLPSDARYRWAFQNNAVS